MFIFTKDLSWNSCIAAECVYNEMDKNAIFHDHYKHGNADNFTSINFLFRYLQMTLRLNKMWHFLKLLVPEYLYHKKGD